MSMNEPRPWKEYKSEVANRIICANCLQAREQDRYLRTDPEKLHLPPDHRDRAIETIAYRLKNCPGVPWCEFTDAEKEKLWHAEEETGGST